MGVSSHAQDTTEPPIDTPVEEVATLNKILVADLAPEIRVILEGQELPTTQVSKDDSGAVYVRAEPIFEALDDVFEYNVDEGVLVVQRSQDGVVMELYTDTGIVKANGRALGKLKRFGEVREGMINLTPNAIAVLSGAIGKIDENENVINFELDPRLKVATGFEVFVNGIPLGQIEPGPKSVGSVLLLPLRPIAKELGHEITLLDGGTSVRVRRSQDSAIFEINLDTGLVKLNSRPYGVSKDVTYIDDINLLLPISTIETLTGTHINVEGGSSRINVDLDDRLRGAIEPGEQVEEITSNEPFILETLQFHTGIDTLNTVDLDFRVKGSNGRIRYEVPDLPMGIKEAEPAWLSLELAHNSGARGSLGDYSADFRELEGVGLHRIRGVSAVKESNKGRWAVAAGVPASGSKQVSEDQSRQTFSGFAAGARYADVKGWEAGVSYKADGLSDDQMAVLSAISGRLGRDRQKKLNWDVRADAGVFNGSARAKSIDFRADADSRYEINKNVNVDVFAAYDGAEFLRSDLDAEDRAQALDPDATVIDPENSAGRVPEVRERGQDHLSYGVGVQVAARKDIGIFNRPAAALRYRQTESGVFEGQDNKSSVKNMVASVNTAILPIDTNITADWNTYTQTKADGTQENGDQWSARIRKDTDYATGRAQIVSDRRNGGSRTTRIDAQISAKPYKIPLPKEAKLSVAPSISGSWTEASDFVRGGVIANFESGDLLGRKTKANASLGILQSFSGDIEDKSDMFLTVGIGRQLRINKNLQLGMSYRNNLRGDQRVGIYLDGRFDFNEKRKFRKTQEGRGVLKGRVFLDKNRDGIKQEDEPGIGGALIRIKPGRLSLRSDRDGYYTVQNINQGLQEVTVDGRSLPLGYTLADDASTKATIREGYITDIALPVVQRGQIRGVAFVDENGDGEHNKGELRLEGAKLILKDLDDPENIHQVYAASFGQYAFGDLPSGRYELNILKTNSISSVPHTPVEVDLAAAKDLMTKINIAAKPSNKTDMAEQNSATGPPGRADKGTKAEIPPPEIPAP
ncbi:MAG: hypothetical protein HKO02_04800 [Hyphomonadaceae bacterium]|nr:hypothetical protein [Hyphomonadaceae bacterium]